MKRKIQLLMILFIIGANSMLAQTGKKPSSHCSITPGVSSKKNSGTFAGDPLASTKKGSNVSSNYALRDGFGVGINEIKNPVGVRVYPNPVSEELNVMFDKTLNKEIKIEVYDLSGKLILQKTVGKVQNKFAINTQGLSPALYTVNVYSIKGESLNNFKFSKIN